MDKIETKSQKGSQQEETAGQLGAECVIDGFVSSCATIVLRLALQDCGEMVRESDRRTNAWLCTSSKA